MLLSFLLRTFFFRPYVALMPFFLIFFLVFSLNFSPKNIFGQNISPEIRPLDSIPSTKWSNAHFVTVSTHQGPVLIHTKALENLMQSGFNGFQAVSVLWGIQSKGSPKRAWEQKLNFPTYGFGGTLYTFHRKNTVGNPFSLYGYVNLPILRSRVVNIFGQITCGLGFNFAKFDSIKNPTNTAIGTSTNLTMSYTIQTDIPITKRFAVRVGAGLTHFSNGTVAQPNLGLNLFDLSIGAKYHFSPYKKIPLDMDFYRYAHPRYVPNWKPYLMAGWAVKQSIPNSPVYWGGALTFGYMRQFSYVQKWGVGVDLFYDQSLQGFPKDNIPFYQYFLQGVHIGHEVMIDRFAIITHIGHYTWQEIKRDLPIYTRIGVKCHINPKLFVLLALKSHGGAADMLEYTTGWQF